MGINAVFFKYAELGGEKILVRSMLVSEEVSKNRRSPRAPKPRPRPEDLDSIAQERNVTELVNICRQMKDVWGEKPSPMQGGSWSYFVDKTRDQGWRSHFRIDVSGADMKTPVGELDLWVNYKNVAEVTVTDETVVQKALQFGYSPIATKYGKVIIRLRTKADAEKFVQQLKEWASVSKPQNGVAQGISHVDLH